MSTHMPGFQSFSRFFTSFCIGQILIAPSSSIRVKLPGGCSSCEPVYFTVSDQLGVTDRWVVVMLST